MRELNKERDTTHPVATTTTRKRIIMFKQSFLVVLLLSVQYCKAQVACTSETAASVCVAPLYKPGLCAAPANKCECAAGTSPNSDASACELSKPTIKETNAGKTYYLNEEYKLECTTAASGVAFKWYKGTDQIANAATATVTIKETTVTTAITYKCEISFDSTNKATSDETSVTFVAPGKPCTSDTDCSGSEFSGKCGTTDPKRCVCATNYVVKEATCKNGASVVNTSLIMLIVAFFSHVMKLF